MEFDPGTFYGNALQFAAVIALAAIVEYRVLSNKLRTLPRSTGLKITYTGLISLLALGLWYTISVSLSALSGTAQPDWQAVVVTSCLTVATGLVIVSPFGAMLLWVWTSTEATKPEPPWVAGD